MENLHALCELIHTTSACSWSFLFLSFFLLSFFPFRSEMSHWSVRTKIRLLRCGITQAVSMRLHKSQIWLRLSSQPPSAVLYHPPLPTQQLCWVGHGDMGKKGGRTWVKVKKRREFAGTYKATLSEHLSAGFSFLFPLFLLYIITEQPRSTTKSLSCCQTGGESMRIREWRDTEKGKSESSAHLRSYWEPAVL